MASVTHCFGHLIVDFEQVNTGWEGFYKRGKEIASHFKEGAYELDFILKLLLLILTSFGKLNIKLIEI